MKQRDAESLAHSSQQPSAKRKREKRPPLWWRITFEEHMVALVRLLGHEGVPVKDLRETAKPLVEKFGRVRLQAAADEITETVGDGDNAVVRLTEQARKLAVHLIGPFKPATMPQAGSFESSSRAKARAPSDAEANERRIPVDTERTDSSTSEAHESKRTGVAPSTTQRVSSTPVSTAAESHSDVTSHRMGPSQSPDREPLDHRDRDWVNYETQCVYRFLIRDQDFLDECRHLAAICRERAASSEEVTSGAPEDSQHLVSRLAAELERFVRQFNPLADETTPFAELLDAALGNVDWYALAESIERSDGGSNDPQ
jgi:hypothetical protein